MTTASDAIAEMIAKIDVLIGRNSCYPSDGRHSDACDGACGKFQIHESADYIDFRLLPQSAGRLTHEWAVVTKDSLTLLGMIQWYPPWRCYAFFPKENTLYEKKCLRSIAAFAEKKTTEQRAAAKARREKR